MSGENRRRIEHGLDLLVRLNGVVAALLFAALTGVVALQVLTRFVLHLPFIWSEEAARFLFFWVALLGAAMSVKSRRHFVLDVTTTGGRAGRDGDAPRARRWLDLLPDACVLAFSLFLLAQGIGYVGVGWLRTASNSQVNMGIVYAAIPVFAGLSAVYAAGNLAAALGAHRNDGRPGPARADAAGAD